MQQNSLRIQLGYILDTDPETFRPLVQRPPHSRDRVVDAGIELARRSAAPSLSANTGAGASRKPVRMYSCCQAVAPHVLGEHARSAVHVCHEYSLRDDDLDAVRAVAQLLARARLGEQLRDRSWENGLRGVIYEALNDSWRRLYRIPSEPIPDARLTRSADQVFAERISRRRGRDHYPEPLMSMSPPGLRRPRWGSA